MALTIYRHTDPGAPQITADTAGSLLAVLYACLVTGYGSKAGAGWTRPFTGTNIAVFLQGGANPRYLRVWDAAANGGDASGNRSAYMRAYETMTAVSTGTNPFPTTTQVTGNGLYTPYRIVGETLPLPWIIRANNNWFDLVIERYPTGVQAGPPKAASNEYFVFGKFPSLKSGDTFNDFIWGGGPAALTPNVLYSGVGLIPSSAMFVARSDTGVAGSKTAVAVANAPTAESYMGQGSGPDHPFPNRPSQRVWMHQYFIYCDGHLRGTFPGVWGTIHDIVSLGGDGTQFTGVGDLAGRTFEIKRTFGAQGSYPNGLILEISDTHTPL